MSHFNKEAANWDNEGKVKMMRVLASKSLEVLNLTNKLDIMDFGCGTGLFGLEFSEFVKSLTGIDTSTGMLKVFDEKTKGHENFKSISINLETDDLDEKFDLIISSMAFHHLNSPKEMIKKFKPLLSDGGKIAIVDLDQEDGTFHPDNKKMGVKHFGFSKEELEGWAKNANMNFTHTFINEICKNEQTFKQFLAVFS